MKGLRHWARVGALSFLVSWMLVLWYLHEELDDQDEDVDTPHNSHFLRTTVDKIARPNKESPSHHHAVVQLPDQRPHGILQDDNPHQPQVTTLTRPHVRPSKEYTIDPNDLWEQSANPFLPDWMKNYFRWHKEIQSAKHHHNHYPSTPTLLLTCPSGSRKCGGTVDRLSPLVFLIYIASRTHRLFLIHWGRPAALEEFLVPPAYGVDWRLRDNDKTATTSDNSVLATSLEALLQAANDTSNLIVRCRFQAPDHGAAFYNARATTTGNNNGQAVTTMEQLTRTVWDLFFTPAPPVAQRIKDFMHQQKLIPGHYLATHIRALYAVKDQDPYVVQYWTQNAVNCTTHLARPDDGNAIFVASDTSLAPKLAQRYATPQGWRIVYHAADVTGNEPLHLDKASRWEDRPPSDFYDAFVDLYLLSLARCVTYGVGGYGKFATWLTGHPKCTLQHHNATAINECSLSPPFLRGEKDLPVIRKNAFRQPMENEGTPRNLSGINISTENSDQFPDTKRHPLENLWEGSTVLPQWMKDYFVFHRQQRQRINGDNWSNYRYLVVACTKASTKCGGTSDRLRPIPYYIRVAAETKRILFIYWNKPRLLETFLLPPVGGMDWRTPPWIVDKLGSNSIKSAQNLPVVAARNDVLIQAQIQSHDHGSHYYDNITTVLDGEAPLAFRRHYHDCWYVLFTPVPEIATEIEQVLRKTSLVPGQYGVAHIRALYGIETEGRNPTEIAEWTRNSINCLSQIRPGGPYFVSSDSNEARRVAIAYGRERNVQIFARTDATQPVHMDIADETQDLSSLREIFVDLFLMSFGRCLSYNMGGFGKWAQLLSGHDFTCNIRHWTRGVDKRSSKVCEWNQADETVFVGKSIYPLFLPPMEETSIERT